MRITLGHSDDPDDAFMVWALAERKVDLRGFEFELLPSDIQTLNEWALEGKLDVTALSLATYPQVQDTYALLPHGASIGRGYGPIVVTREPARRTTASPFSTSNARAKTGSRTVGPSNSADRATVGSDSGFVPSRRSRTNSASLSR